MSRMWKPGTSKPPPSKTTTSPNNSKPTANGSSSNKKKLSGATMGMRFMQRKMQAEASRQEQSQQQDEDSKMEWEATEKDDDKQGPAEEETTTTSVPQTATPSDMYGMKSDLIGRRSFGGYCPHVNASYQSTRKTYEKGKTTDGTKQHISDEELLRRYKDYKSGRGDMIDSAAAAPIGNLEEKLKKRGKRKNQSPAHKGGKRKR